MAVTPEDDYDQQTGYAPVETDGGFEQPAAPAAPTGIINSDVPPWEYFKQQAAPAAPRKKGAFHPDVERAIDEAVDLHGADRNYLRTTARIESGGDPTKQTGRYKGTFMLSDDEFRRYGGTGDIFDPFENAKAAALKAKTEAAAFEKRYGRQPLPNELYLTHQQGEGGYDSHTRNPDAPAWENMYRTAEGRQKGPAWAKQAVWGNLPDSEKRRFGSVENVTSRDFTDAWNRRYDEKAAEDDDGPVQLAQAPRGGVIQSDVPPWEYFKKTAPKTAGPGEPPPMKQPTKAEIKADEDERRGVVAEPSYEKLVQYGAQKEGVEAEIRQIRKEMAAAPPAERQKYLLRLEEAGQRWKKVSELETFARPTGMFDIFGGNLTPEQAKAELASRMKEIPGQVADQERLVKDLEAVKAKKPNAAPSEQAQTVLRELGRGVESKEVLDSVIEHHRQKLEELKTEQKNFDEMAKGLRPGFKLSATRSGIENVLQGVGNTITSIPKFAGYAAGYLGRPFGISDPETNSLVKAAEWVEDLAKVAYPGDPARQKDFSQKLSQGAGSMIGFMGVGKATQLLTGGSRVAGTAGTALTGGASQGAETVEEATTAMRGVRRLKDDKGKTTLYTPEEKDRLLAAGWGFLLGTSEAIPIERALRRPSGGQMRQIFEHGRIGALEEGAQEFGQSVGGNLVARNYYDPTRDIFEGTGEATLIGGILGYKMGAAKATLDAWKGRHAEAKDEDEHQRIDKSLDTALTGALARGEIAEKDIEGIRDQIKKERPEALSGFDATISDWRRGAGVFQRTATDAHPDNLEQPGNVLAAAGARTGRTTPPPLPGEAEQPQPELPAPAAPLPPTTAEVSVLQRMGYTPDDIREMDPAQRAAEMEDAKSRGILPDTAGKAGGPPPVPQAGAVPPPLPGRSQVPDNPSAEPVADILAQTKDLGDPKHPRQGVYLSRSNMDALAQDEAALEQVSNLLGRVNGDVINNVDGNGGMLIAKTAPIAREIERAIANGEDLQAVLGRVTGAGQGKPADASAVVQQVTPEGAVTRESAVAEGDIEKTLAEFRKGGRDARVVTPDQAIARREQGREPPPLPAGDGSRSVRKEYTEAQTTLINELDRVIGAGGADGADAKRIRDLIPPPGSPIKDWRKADVASDTSKLGPIRHAMGAVMNERPQVPPGSRQAPVTVQKPEDVARAGERVADPTDAQKDAGNYAKGHIKFQGLDITIENPKGSIRRGTSPDGTPWQTEMVHAYGYIKRTEGRDSDQVDVYVGDNVNAPNAYIVDQVDPDTRRFDEHKTFVGFNSKSDAQRAHAYSFSDGKGGARMGGITEMPMVDFKEWLAKGKRTRPVSNLAKKPDSESVQPTETTLEQADKLPDNLTDAERETLVKAWRYVNAIEQARAQGRDIQQTRLDIANELDADLASYGISFDEFPNEQSLREYLGSGRTEDQGRNEGVEAPEAAQAKGDTPAGSGRSRGEEAPVVQREQADGRREGDGTRDGAAQVERQRVDDQFVFIGPDGKAKPLLKEKTAEPDAGKQTDLVDMAKADGRLDAVEMRSIMAKGENAYAMSDDAVMQADPYADFWDKVQDPSFPDEVNKRFQAHGMVATSGGSLPSNLLHLLANGWTTARPLNSGHPRGDATGVGTTRVFGAPFVILSNIDESLRDTGVKNVVLVGPAVALKRRLEADWPGVKFMTPGQGMRFMLDMAAAKNTADATKKPASKEPAAADLREGTAEEWGRAIRRYADENLSPKDHYERVANLFRNQGIKPFPYKEADFRPAAALRDKLISDGFDTIVEARKFARSLGLDGNNKALDEIIEAAVVDAARDIVQEGKNPSATYSDLVALYNNQPNLASRTGTSVANQAYSTPMPLAYLASRLAGVAKADSVYEPTAGNGALLIEADPKTTTANELDPRRAAALRAQGFTVTENDGSLVPKAKDIESVIMNPPFGAVKEGGQSKTFTVGDWSTTQIDHAVALNGLEAMDDNGKAVLILGGIKAQDVKERRKGYRGQAKREFYVRLYNQYNVVDHFTVSGDLYKKQGAGWPVDVIVIDGRGKSDRALPAANPPAVLNTWDELAEKLPNASNDARAVDETAGRPVEPVGQSADGNAPGSEPDAGTRSERPAAEPKAKPARVRKDAAGGQSGSESATAAVERNPEAGVDRDSGRTDQPDTPSQPRVKTERKATPKSSGQANYEAASSAADLGTLIPVNMADAAKDAMQRVAKRHGDVNSFVATSLGYQSDADGPYFINDKGAKERPFAAEQIDAIASAIDNAQRGAAFIIGDQTGIGKGRTAAGMLRYAMRQGFKPVFVTEKPDLYGDMFRDLRDIGVPQMLGREPQMFITNAGATIPLDEEALAWKQEADAAREAGTKIPAKRGKFLSGGTAPKIDATMRKIANGEAMGADGLPDVIFTTYDQMNTVKGQETDRRRFLTRIASDSFVVLDESHNAGGAAKTGWEKKGAPLDRAAFTRDIAAKAKGVLFSSATYAKRPDVMDLYARTDMGRAVDDPKQLPALIQRGGVPMQQIVASMLANSGQYLRRERSFEGVEYAVEGVPVNQQSYRQFSDAIRAIFKFDLAVKEARKEIMEDILDAKGMAMSKDSGVGESAAHTTAFASIMHNIVNQMLLAIKSGQAAKRAIAATKAGEKPVIALANTNESFIKDFAEQENISLGQVLDMDFGEVLRRYLARTLRVTIKHPDKTKEHVDIPVERLGPGLQAMYRDALDEVNAGSFDGMPISPIDWIRHEVGQAGLKVAEVTGRQTMIDYSASKPKYVARPKSEMGPAGKRGSIAAFNRGSLDVLILNRSGSTGVSMHASKDFRDQRRRRMIIAQAEGNIDTHLQMLGRVHRTGQVIPPAYSQIAAEIPAEARPTAVLMKKMASLNANTTGARGSVFMADSVDFMNEIGDKVVADLLLEDSELDAELGGALKVDNDGIPVNEDAAKRATGRLVLLTPEKQAEFLERVQKGYKSEIEQLDALGENPLEAKTLDLQAKTLDTTILKPKQGESAFLDEVRVEKASVKAQGRAMLPSDIAAKVAEALKVSKPDGDVSGALRDLEGKGRMAKDAKVRETVQRAREWIRTDVADLSQDAKESTRRRHEEQVSRWVATMNAVYPGARVTLAMPAGDMEGIVMSVERTGKAKLPVALGSWEARIAVPDGAREYIFPFSKLFPPSVVKGDGEKGAEVAPSSNGYPDMVAAFEEARKEGRETRFIVTGNILGGFDQVAGKGRIVNYTTDSGEMRPGVLMGRDFDIEKFMGKRAIRFQAGAQVSAFLDKVPAAEVKDTDGNISIKRHRGEFTIEMPASRSVGGKFYTDPDVRKAIAPRDFERRGNKMIVMGLPRADATAAIEAMRKIGAIFETREAQDVAQGIVTQGAPKAQPDRKPTKPASGSSKAVNDFANAVGDLKNKLGVTTRPLSRDDDTKLRSIADDMSGTTAVAKLSDRIKAMTKGSRVQVVAEHAAAYVSDADAIVEVAKQQNEIDPDELSLQDVNKLAAALFDLKQIIDQRVQTGYALAEDVQSIRDLLSDRMDDLASKFEDIWQDASNVADELNSKWEEIQERIDELDEAAGRDPNAEEDDGTELSTQTEQYTAFVTPAEYAAQESPLDVFNAEDNFSRGLIKSLSERSQDLVDVDIDEMDRDGLTALQARISKTVATSIHLKDWMDSLRTKAQDASGQVWTEVGNIEDEQIIPAVDRLEDVQSDIDDSLERAIDAKEIGEGQIITIDSIDYGPSMVRGLIASWKDWLKTDGVTQLEKTLEKRPAFGTKEWEAERRKNIAKVEGDLAKFEAALAQYEGGFRSISEATRNRTISRLDYVKGRILLRQPVDLSHDADRMFDLMKNEPSALPNSIPETIVTKLAPKRGAPGRYIVTARDKNGTEYTYEDDGALISRTQGIYLLLDGRPAVTLLPLDFGGDFVKRVVAVRAHESVHALRANGFLPGNGRDLGSAWGRLVGHADLLGVLHMSRAELYERMGDARSETSAREVTTLEVYTEVYGTKPHAREMLDQEAVAHMVEVYKLGGWSEQEVAPVKDLLDDILSGRTGQKDRSGIHADMLDGMRSFRENGLSITDRLKAIYLNLRYRGDAILAGNVPADLNARGELPVSDIEPIDLSHELSGTMDGLSAVRRDVRRNIRTLATTHKEITKLPAGEEKDDLLDKINPLLVSAADQLKAIDDIISDEKTLTRVSTEVAQGRIANDQARDQYSEAVARQNRLLLKVIEGGDTGVSPDMLRSIQDSEVGQSMRRDLDALGYYSKALEAARGLQAKGTPEQMLAQLKKAGVKDAEIEATGLAQLFKEKAGSTTALESDAITLPSLDMPKKAALKIGDRVFTGANHSISQDAAEKALGKSVVDAAWNSETGFGDQEGFVTAAGRYVTRKQAVAMLNSVDAFRAKVGLDDGAELHSAHLRELQASVPDLFAQQQGDRTASPPRRAALNQITRDEIIQHLEENRVGLKEVVRGRKLTQSDRDEIAARVNNARKAEEAAKIELRRHGNGSPEQAAAFAALAAATDALRSAEREAQLAKSGVVPTTYSRYSLDPSNPTYRETVLHLPVSIQDTVAFIRERRMEAVARGDLDAVTQLAAEERNVVSGELAPEKATSDAAMFRTGHFSEPNIIGHMMTSMTRHEGKAVYTIDQIQSDWGQKLRDGGVRDEAKIAELKAKLAEEKAKFFAAIRQKFPGEDPMYIPEPKLNKAGISSAEWDRLQAEVRTAEASSPGHPLVNTTDQWTTTTLRRAIRQAAEAGAEYIAIPSGDTVLRYNPGDENGMRHFYGTAGPFADRLIRDNDNLRADKQWSEDYKNELRAAPPIEGIVPKNLRKILNAIDKATGKPQFVDALETPSGMRGAGFTLFPLTEKVRDSVMEMGQPLFSFYGGGFDGRVPDKSSIERMIREVSNQVANDAAGVGTRGQHVGDFAKQWVVQGDGNSVTLVGLYEAYSDWSDALKVDPLSLQRFKAELSDAGLVSQRIAGRLRYVGVGILGPNERPEPILSKPSGPLAAAAEANVKELTERISFGQSFMQAVRSLLAKLTRSAQTDPEIEIRRSHAEALERVANDNIAGAPVSDNVRPLFSLGSDPARKNRVQTLGEINEAINIIQRVAGPAVELDLRSVIDPASIGVNALQITATEQAGLSTATAGGYYNRPSMLNARAVIGLALADPAFDVRTTAGHEAFHHVEEVLATNAEKRLLRSEPEMRRMRKLAGAEIGMSASDPNLARLPEKEIRAIAFQRYRRMREEGLANASGIHIGIRKLFDRLARIFHGVRNLLRGKGYDSYEAIFERARTGEMVASAADRDIAGRARGNQGVRSLRGIVDPQMRPTNFVQREPFDLANVQVVRRYQDRVPLANVYTSQRSISVAAAQAKVRNPSTDDGRQISLFKFDGRYYVNDGNHRVEAARAFKMPSVNAEVIELAPKGRRDDADFLEDRGSADVSPELVGAEENSASTQASLIGSDPRLDMSFAARKARAESMGFDTSKVWYRGRGNPTNLEAFDIKRQGNVFGQVPITRLGIFASDTPSIASVYARDHARRGELRVHHMALYQSPLRQALALRDPIFDPPGNGANVVPFYARPGKQIVIDVKTLPRDRDPSGVPELSSYNALYENLTEAKRDGYDTAIIRNNPDADHKRPDGTWPEELVLFNPKDARSVNAEFDPAQDGSPQIMASLIPTAAKVYTQRWLDRLQPKFDTLRIAIQDKALPIRRQEEAIEAATGAVLPDQLRTYMAEAIYHGRAGERLIDLQQDTIEPFIEHLRKNGIKFDVFGDYLYARHAIERNAAIVQIDPANISGSGMTDAEARGVIGALEQGKRGQAFKDAAAMVDKMLSDTRDTLLRSGLITREQYDNWSTKYQHYVPLRGFEADEDENGIPRIGRGMDIRGPEAMQALGRRSKADNPAAYAMQQAVQAIIRSEKNRVDKTLYRAINAHPDPDVWRVFKGEASRRINPSTGLVEVTWVPPAFSARNKENVFGVKIAGKQYYMEILHEPLAQSLRSSPSWVLGTTLGRGLYKASRFYAQLVTSYNPEFVISNYLRDIQTALMNVGDVAQKPDGTRKKIVAEALSLKSIRGVMAALQSHEGRTIFGAKRAADETMIGTKRSQTAQDYAKWFEEYRLAGGKISFIEQHDIDRIKTRIEKSVSEGKIKRGLRNVFDLVDNANSAVENGVRLSVYIALRKHGISQDRSAFISRELTVNFNRKGEWGPAINAFYLFFNASMQGTTRLAQAAIRSQVVRRGLAGIFLAGALMDVMNYMIAADDDDGENSYEKIKDWVKEKNMIVMLPGRKDYVEIPMPYGYNVFFLSGQKTAALTRSAAGYGKEKPVKALAALLGAVMESFSPLGAATTWQQMVSPTLLDPFVQIDQNKNWFGGKIYPDKLPNQKHKPDSEMFYSTAPAWAVDLARSLNRLSGGNKVSSGYVDVSPETIEHLVEFAGGGVAKFAANLWNTGERAIKGKEWLPEKTPFVRRLYGKATTESRRRDFYEKWNDVDQAHYQFDELRKAKDFEGMAEVRREHAADLAAYEAMRATSRQLGVLRKQSDAINLNRDLDKDTKEQRLKVITDRENEIILRALATYNRLKKDKEKQKKDQAE